MFTLLVVTLTLGGEGAPSPIPTAAQLVAVEAELPAAWGRVREAWELLALNRSVLATFERSVAVSEGSLELDGQILKMYEGQDDKPRVERVESSMALTRGLIEQGRGMIETQREYVARSLADSYAAERAFESKCRRAAALRAELAAPPRVHRLSR